MDLNSKFENKKLLIIGSSYDCDIVLDHPSVCKLHVSIEKNGNNQYGLKVLSSHSGVYFRGIKLRALSYTTISDEDVFNIGVYAFSIKHGGYKISEDMAIRVNRISKKFSNGKLGLHPTSFEIPAKSLVAILGPSGCGKSTLLKTLNGDSPCSEGKIHLCGLELNQTNFEYLKTHIGYVPQDDIVHSELTVEQSLWYAAKLRLKETTNTQIRKKIDQVLDTLSISNIKKDLVGSISGGQRKRVSIAVEILTDPLILFLDEPTSPLDPQTIGDFLKTLKKLAENGTTVLMVTHKPEDLKYMDKAMFMAKGGHLTYFGDSQSDKYLKYFESGDILEVYSKLANETSTKWIENYNLENPHKNIAYSGIPNIHQENHTSYISQYFWLTIRYLNIKLNDKLNLLIMLAQAPIIAALICLIFPSLTQTVLFFMAISAIWFGTNNAAREIVVEKSIFKRERMFNQGIFPYILSKITVLGIIAFVQSLMFTAIIWYYFKSETPQFADPKMSFLWFSSLSICSTLLGLLLSALVNTAEKVMSIIPLILIPQIMLAGVIVKINNVIIELLSYLTISRWGTIGFAKIQKTVAVPHYITEPGTGKFDESTMNFIPPKIIKSSADEVTNTMNLLNENFHETYHKNFAIYNDTIAIDYLVIGFISIIFFSAIFLALKDKDSFN